MGKNLIQQARGKGGPTYKIPSFRHKGKPAHKKVDYNTSLKGIVVDLISCQGHTAPLALVKYEDSNSGYVIACEGLKVGDSISVGSSELEKGSSVMLKDVPEGTLVYNIESRPGDGGKFVRASGTFGKVVTKSGDRVTIILPSKKQKVFNMKCKASIGVVAGGGRTDKPFLKAGIKHYTMKARHKLWPVVSGSAQNAVDHPIGNKRTARKSKAKPVSRHAPPGRKVGSIAARRTGRRKK